MNQASDRTGVLLAQTGSPAAPTPRALRRYLRQFLSDRRVIELSPLIWRPILELFVLRSRPARSAERYRRIWNERGSPLIAIAADQARLLKQRLQHSEVEIEIGMRIGEPSLDTGIEQLLARGCSRIILFPLFAQYASATTGSIVEAALRHLQRKRFIPALSTVPPFFRHPLYLKAQAERINQTLRAMEAPPERLLLSYHGLPESYVRRGDPYAEMCSATSAGLLPLLAIEPGRVISCYQSRFGRAEWLKPYTEDTLRSLARQGIKTAVIACPSFVTDCLETLDEIGNEADELFREHGGKKLTLVPCLNTNPLWIDAMAALVDYLIPSKVAK